MFYDNFRRLAYQKGVPVSKVTEDIGLTPAAAAWWKKGSVPRLEVLQKLSEYFGVDMDDLIGGGDPAGETVPATKEEADQISEEVRPKILKYDLDRLKEENERLKAENEYLKGLVTTLSESIRSLSVDKKTVPPVGVSDIYSNVKRKERV